MRRDVRRRARRTTTSSIRLVRLDDDRVDVALYRLTSNQEIAMHILTTEQIQHIHGAGSVADTAAVAVPTNVPTSLPFPGHLPTGPGCIRPLLTAADL